MASVAGIEAQALPPGRGALGAMRLALHGEDARAPEWIQVSPLGPVVRGRDQRSYRVEDAQRLVEASEVPLLIDRDHESVFGFSTVAAGWLDRLEVVTEPDGERTQPGIWAHVERWTPEGRADVEAGRFRMISPVVVLGPSDEDGHPLALAIENVALTNRPNLRMAALHSVQEELTMSEEEMATLRAALGLGEDADGAAVLEAVNALLEAATKPEDKPAESPETASAQTQLRVVERELAAARERLRVIDEAAAKRAREEAEASVDVAIKDGRAHADCRADLLRLATSDREEDRAAFARLTAQRAPGTAPRGRVAGAERHALETGADGFTEEERFVFVNLRAGGLTAERARERVVARREIV